jgi:hypothetical protein
VYGEGLAPLGQLDAAGRLEVTLIYLTRDWVPDLALHPDGTLYRVISDPIGSGRLANVLDGFGPNQGFTGVFDPSSGRIGLRPSPSSASAPVPPGWVPRRGGHADVSRELGGDQSRHLGFAVIIQEGGGLSVTWRSGTLNPPPAGLVPEAQRRRIVERQTGRRVVSF